MWADADVCSNWNIQLEKNKGFMSLGKYLLQEVKTYLKVKPMKSLHSHTPSLGLAMAQTDTNRGGGGCLCLKWSLMFPEDWSVLALLRACIILIISLLICLILRVFWSRISSAQWSVADECGRMFGILIRMFKSVHYSASIQVALSKVLKFERASLKL